VDSGRTFADALRRHRRAQGLTQAELAERAHLSERAINDLERGLKHPQRGTVSLLVEALALSPDEAERFEVSARSRSLPLGRTGSQAKHNLPLGLTSFVGREQAIVDLQRRLDPTSNGNAPRLVTLTGAGGCGKTRLSLEVAQRLAEAFPDGAWFIDLSPLTDERLVAVTVLRVLGAREAPGQEPLEALLHAVRGRSLLLVLDNCEHLVQSCAELVAELLRATTTLRILATSRELLRVPSEAAWRVPSLAVPDAAHVHDPTDLAVYEAVRLFVNRIRLVQPEFSLNETNASAVAHICSRLDGIPLAIELAAARGATMAVPDIAARLDDCFRLLTGGSRVALPRQRTLQATIDWGHELLSSDERTLFRRLGVFAGGWTLEAAEAVGAGDALEQHEILEQLMRLVDRSLVSFHEQDGGTRYRLLETVRIYASERLQESGEAEVVKKRHVGWCLAFAEQAAIELGGAGQVAASRRFVAEQDNVRAALDFCRADPAGSEDELRLAAALGQFWRLQHPSEGRRRLAEALARARHTPSSARAAALIWQASIELLYGDPQTGQALAEESLSDARAVGDDQRAAHAFRQLALATPDNDPAARVALLEQGLAFARAAGADSEAGMLLAFLATAAAEAGELQRAGVLLEEGAALGRRSGDAFGWVQPLYQLGWLAVVEGRLVDAEAHFQHALQLAEGIGYAAALGFALIGLGQVALRRGRLDESRAHHREGLIALRESGGAYLASALVYLAALEEAAGSHDRAQRLLGASEAWHAARGGAQRTWLPVTHSPLKRGLVPVPPVPTDATLARARDEGRAMPLDQAVAWALQPLEVASSAAR